MRWHSFRGRLQWAARWALLGNAGQQRKRAGRLLGSDDTAIVDTACGYAALSLMPGDCEVLTVEYKVNLLAKAVGRRFIAHGWVVKPGKTISVCSGEVRADSGDGVKLVASMMATMFTVRGSAT